MITSSYGINKTIHFNSKIKAEVGQLFGTPGITLTLGGAKCFQNPNSYELGLVKSGKKTELHIPEYDSTCFYALKNFLVNVVKLDNGVYSGYIRGYPKAKITIYNIQLGQVLALFKNKKCIDVINADYYDSILNPIIREDIALMFSLNVLSTKYLVYINTSVFNRTLGWLDKKLPESPFWDIRVKREVLKLTGKATKLKSESSIYRCDENIRNQMCLVKLYEEVA